jgi:hypothetical protein
MPDWLTTALSVAAWWAVASVVVCAALALIAHRMKRRGGR